MLFIALHIKCSSYIEHMIKSLTLQPLTSSGLHLAVLLETDSRDGNEAGGLSRREVTNLVHAGLGHVVQLLGFGRTAEDGDAALVGPAADLAVDALLGGGDGGLEELTLGGEVEAVVQDLGVVDGDKLVTESTDFTVHNETLEVNVSSAQKSETRGLVAATRLDTNETVLNNVNTTDTVATGNGVGCEEKLDRVGNGLLLAILGVLELDGDTLLEVDDEVFRLLRGLERVDSQLPHVGRGSGVGVFQDTGLVRAVGQVLVHTPGLGLGGGDGDVLLSGIVEQGVTTSEAVVEDGVTPRGNDLDVGLQGVESKLETDLVVTLAGATVRDGNGALTLSDINLSTSDDGASKRSSYFLSIFDISAIQSNRFNRHTQKVNVLVDGVTGDGGEAKLIDEFPCSG